jgi:hypothetical protein
MNSRHEHTIGAILIALCAGVVSTLIAYFPLLSVFYRTGIIRFVFFGPGPNPGLWILPTLIRSSLISNIVVGGIVAWLVFRLLDQKLYPPRLPTNRFVPD